MKLSRPVTLPTVLWAEIDDLVPAFGGDRHEVLGFIVQDWLSINHERADSYTRAVRRVVGYLSDKQCPQCCSEADDPLDDCTHVIHEIGAKHSEQGRRDG